MSTPSSAAPPPRSPTRIRAVRAVFDPALEVELVSASHHRYRFRVGADTGGAAIVRERGLAVTYLGGSAAAEGVDLRPLAASLPLRLQSQAQTRRLVEILRRCAPSPSGASSPSPSPQALAAALGARLAAEPSLGALARVEILAASGDAALRLSISAIAAPGAAPLIVALRLRGAAGRARAWTGGFAIDWDDDAPHASCEQALLAVFWILLDLDPGLGPVLVEPARLPPPIEPPGLLASFETDGPLSLVLEQDCQSRCAFCSVRELRPAITGATPALHARILDALARGRARGLTALRLEGYDPLRYPRVVEVVRAARDAGYDAIDFYAPMRNLAEPAGAGPTLLDALLAVAPPRIVFHVPLYGATAAAHDAVVGVPGAFADVMASVELLRARVGPEEIRLSTILVAGYLGEFRGIVALARRWALTLYPGLPFPTRDAPSDRYHAVVPRFSDVVPVLYAPGSQFHAPEIPACIRFRHQRATGVPAFSAFAPTPSYLPGEYCNGSLHGDPAAARPVALDGPRVVACPHASSCALASRCPARVYEAYAEHHGLDELVPVSAREAEAAGV